MKKIDRETVQRILDAADIVEVVSDFVTLKRRGANYIGLCPFHNERTPSFSVSKSKGICKCFSCGKGGSAVNFIMELEQLSYYEALKYLAKKYNIEIKEHEMTTAEQEAESLRESLFAVNDFALAHFEKNLTHTDDGRLIGLSYFRERGISDPMIARFHLGYAIDRSDDFVKSALNAGYQEKYLIDTGLCIKNDRGQVYDRFKGRVIYPVHTISGKVVAFGGRTLRKDKNVAKYVNSPESAIYSKSRELYGLYQAKQAIVKADKCILVEGYMDVISMHQAGVENVVASSGTSLTDAQVRLIHRFTENVTVIYDSDPAGIKASLRGIDMLLSEGLNIKVLLLPEGDDPDSFAQSHSSTEVLDYIKQNETDFIRFKTNILLADAGNDPIQRSKVITDIVRSISLIPVEMTREAYIRECSRMLDVDERALKAQLRRNIAAHAEKLYNEKKQQQAKDSIKDIVTEEKPRASDSTYATSTTPQTTHTETTIYNLESHPLDKSEREILRYVVKYGMAKIGINMDNDDGSVEIQHYSVIDYIYQELNYDNIQFTNPLYADVFAQAITISKGNWEADSRANESTVQVFIRDAMTQGLDEIRKNGADVADIQRREQKLQENVEQQADKIRFEFAAAYIASKLINSPDDKVRALAADLISQRHHLSNIYSKGIHVPHESERLSILVPASVYTLKYEILKQLTAQLHQQIKIAVAAGDNNKVVELMQQVQQNNIIKSNLAKVLGERIVTP